MINDLDKFYLSKNEPAKSCLLALRSIILTKDCNISETQKYGMPCFCFMKKAFCYLWIDKKTEEPYLLLVEGKYLNHPSLETGNRSRMKILRVKPEEDIPVETINLVLQMALDFYKSAKHSK